MESVTEQDGSTWVPVKITDGPLAGYEWYPDSDPFETMAGPMGRKRNEDGSYSCAFFAEEKHCNGHGNLHGGMLMTFADYSLFGIASDVLDGPCVTVSFNSEFISAVGPGQLIEARGEVVRNTRSLVFVRGTIMGGGQTLLTFSGIVKRIKK